MRLPAPADIGGQVRLAGWVAAKRDHGGLLFVDLRDPAGRDADLLVARSGEDSPTVGAILHGDHRARVVQLVCHPGSAAFDDPVPPARGERRLGHRHGRRSSARNRQTPKLLTGEVEVEVGNVEVLSSSDVLPFPVERDSDVGEEARLNYRYLDMRRGPLAERLARRARSASWSAPTCRSAASSRSRRRC